ncbi:putative Zinc finger, C3HC [Helianthus anomalus]
MTTKLDLVDLKSKRSMAEELKYASGGAVDPPVCRPWDREDLLKRLATFKSMTWFAKPECDRQIVVNFCLQLPPVGVLLDLGVMLCSFFSF